MTSDIYLALSDALSGILLAESLRTAFPDKMIVCDFSGSKQKTQVQNAEKQNFKWVIIVNEMATVKNIVRKEQKIVAMAEIPIFFEQMWYGRMGW